MQVTTASSSNSVSSDEEHYNVINSPRQPKKKATELIQELSTGISDFNDLIESIQNKMSLFGTNNDSRQNHNAISSLVDDGEKLSSKLKHLLKGLAKAIKLKENTNKKPQLHKLTTDFKQQLNRFEGCCTSFMTSERKAIEVIRTTSESFIGNSQLNNDTSDYDENQIYAQANVTHYNEDDLARREEDIIHINHQLKEVNAAYREIDGIIKDQEEVIVEINENAEVSNQRVQDGLEQVQQADTKEGYCNCTKKKMICYGFIAIFVVVLALSVVLALKG